VFIIEHPTRGTLSSLISTEEYHFSWSGSRADPDKAMQFYTIEEAKSYYRRLPAKVQTAGLAIRDSDQSYEVVFP
jgi:hypothetical protein